MANENKVTIKLVGRMRSAYNVQTKDDNGNVEKSTNIISLFRDGLVVDKGTMTTEGNEEVNDFFAELYKNTAKKWVPDWFKENKDFMQVKSGYNIPCMIKDDGVQMSFAEFVERGNIRDAKVIVKCNVKDSTLYPNAMMILEEGKPYDAFENF